MTYIGSASYPSPLALQIAGWASQTSGQPCDVTVEPSVFDDHTVEALRFTLAADSPEIVDEISTIWGVTLTDGAVDGWTVLVYQNGEFLNANFGDDEDTLDLNLRIFLKLFLRSE